MPEKILDASKPPKVNDLERGNHWSLVSGKMEWDLGRIMGHLKEFG